MDQTTIPVFACARDEWTTDMVPIGHAESAGHAARMLNKFLAERDGADYSLRGRDLYYSRPLNAYFTEE